MSETTKSTGRKKRTATKKAQKSRSTRSTRRGARTKITPEERFRMIQEAAYFMAEQDGFQKEATEYWLRAEAEIDARITSGKL